MVSAAQEGPTFDQRVAMHAALGDPARLAIVDDLIRSDRSPSELGRRHGLSSNLLAHHLEVLERAGLVARAASAGDARRRYVRLVTDHLAGVVASPPSPLTAPTHRPMVFLCTRNSARSQLAAAVWRRRSGVAAASAGTSPAPEVHRLALEAGARHGLDLAGARPQGLAADLLVEAQVVTVCDRVHEDLDPGPDWWHWSIPDPVPAGTPAAFDAVIHELESRVARLLPTSPDTLDRSPA